MLLFRLTSLYASKMAVRHQCAQSPQRLSNISWPATARLAALLWSPLPDSMHRSKTILYSITSSARAESPGWHFKAERLGRLEVDHEFELGCLLNRNVRRLLAVENPARIVTDKAGRQMDA